MVVRTRNTVICRPVIVASFPFAVTPPSRKIFPLRVDVGQTRRCDVRPESPCRSCRPAPARSIPAARTARTAPFLPCATRDRLSRSNCSVGASTTLAFCQTARRRLHRDRRRTVRRHAAAVTWIGSDEAEHSAFRLRLQIGVRALDIAFSNASPVVRFTRIVWAVVVMPFPPPEETRQHQHLIRAVYSPRCAHAFCVPSDIDRLPAA